MKLRKENELKLEDRRNLLNQYETIITDDELLEMLDKDFNLFLSSKKEIYLAKKEAELKAEQERINREKEIEEAKKQARLEAEKQQIKEKELAEKRQEFIKYRDSIDFDHFEDKDGFRIFYKKV